MSVHTQRLKTIEFAIGATQFECQISKWQITNNTDDGDRQFTFCPDGEFYEEADPTYALELTFFADWRSAGISEFLWANDGTTAAFTLVHLPGVAGEEQTWTGTVKVKAPTVGGDVRTTEVQEITLPIIGRPDKVRSA